MALGTVINSKNDFLEQKTGKLYLSTCLMLECEQLEKAKKEKVIVDAKEKIKVV